MHFIKLLKAIFVPKGDFMLQVCFNKNPGEMNLGTLVLTTLNEVLSEICKDRNGIHLIWNIIFPTSMR